jgi:hypothetical protein
MCCLVPAGVLIVGRCGEREFSISRDSSLGKEWLGGLQQSVVTIIIAHSSER